MTLYDFVVTQCAERVLRALVTESANYAGTYICQQCSLSSAVDIFMKYVYLEENLKTCNLRIFFQ
jgi:hypothetical protein